MDLVPSDKARGLQTPVWAEYKKIVNAAEGKEVCTCVCVCVCVCVCLCVCVCGGGVRGACGAGVSGAAGTVPVL